MIDRATPGNHPPTVAARALAPVVSRLAALGLDVDAMLARRGIDPQHFTDDGARIPLRQTEGIWEEAAELSGDDAFGLHLAENMQPDSFGLFSYLAVSSATWGVALRRVCDFFGLLSDASGYELVDEGRSAGIRLRPYPGFGLPRQVAEFSLAVLCCYGRRLLESPLMLSNVTFTHIAPHKTSEHRRIFQAPVEFSQPVAALWFDHQILNAPLASGDEKLAGILEGSARAELQPSEGRPFSLEAQISALLPELMRHGPPSLEDVARQLARSPRTLQRQLAADGLSFRCLVGRAQADLAGRLLQRTELSTAEVAALVGYSEVAAFHRAFKRETGMTPGQYRKHLDAGDVPANQGNGQ